MWLGALDPDRSRLRVAGRATLASAASAASLYALGAPPTSTLLAAAMAMMGSVSVTDATRREQAKTEALLVPAALGGLVLGVAGGSSIVGLVALVVVSAASIAARRVGARGTAAGLVAFNATFFAVFFRAPLAELPALIGAVCAGLACSAVMRLLVWPDRHDRIARTALASTTPATSSLLDALAVIARDGENARRLRRVRRALHRLNELALVVDDQCTHGAPPDVRKEAWAREIAAGSFAVAVLAIERRAHPSPDVRAALVAAIAARSKAPLADAIARSRDRPRLAVALEMAGDDLANLGAPSPVVVDEPVGDAKPIALPNDGLHASTRQAVQAALAVALAIVAGRLIAPDRWYWAAIAAYIVIAPVPTREQIVVRAGSRIIGTAAGVAAGMTLAHVVAGHTELALLLVFACMFGGLFALKSHYAIGMALFTALLAMLYELLGRYSPSILYVRIAETAAGAALGALVAVLVLPAKASAHVIAAAKPVLEAVADVIDAPSIGTQRALDRAVADLRVTAESITRSVVPLGDAPAIVQALSTLAFYTRQLAVALKPLADDARKLARGEPMARTFSIDSIDDPKQAVAAAAVAESLERIARDLGVR